MYFKFLSEIIPKFPRLCFADFIFFPFIGRGEVWSGQHFSFNSVGWSQILLWSLSSLWLQLPFSISLLGRYFLVFCFCMLSAWHIVSFLDTNSSEPGDLFFSRTLKLSLIISLFIWNVHSPLAILVMLMETFEVFYFRWSVCSANTKMEVFTDSKWIKSPHWHSSFSLLEKGKA